MSTKIHNPHSISSLRFVFDAIYPFRLYLVALVCILLIYSGNVFLKTQLIKMLIDSVVQTTSMPDELWALVGHFGVVLLIEVLAFRLQEWCTLRYEPALQNHITELLFKHTIQCDYSFFQKNLAGNLAVKVHDVTTGVPTAVAIFLYDYFVNFLLFVVACITLWRVYTWLALSVVLWSLLTILMAILTTKPSLRLAGHAAEKFSQIPAHIADVFNNVLTTRLFAAQAHTLRRLHHLQKKYVQSSHRYRWFALKFYTLQGISFQLYQGLCMLLLVRMHTRGTVTAGEFAMILSTNLIITESLWKMFERMQTLNTLGGKISQALKVLLTPSYIQDKPHATSLVVNTGAICFKHVTFGYEKTSHLFHNQTVHIAARQKIGLVGCSGSGKTTFINLIARLYDVDSGAILIDGQDIRDVTQRSLHKAMTVVTQDSTLFHSTILENIRYGNPDATDNQIIEAAKSACAHTFIMQLPQQYETHVGARGLSLSGGQRQRVAIARALLQDAPIVLLDEVSAHLDTATEQALNDSLAVWLHDKTVLTISHKLTTLKQMDRMLVFDNGKIVEDGSHHQLLAQGGYYATLWSMSDKELLFTRNDQPTQ